MSTTTIEPSQSERASMGSGLAARARLAVIKEWFHGDKAGASEAGASITQGKGPAAGQGLPRGYADSGDAGGAGQSGAPRWRAATGRARVLAGTSAHVVMGTIVCNSLCKGLRMRESTFPRGARGRRALHVAPLWLDLYLPQSGPLPPCREGVFGIGPGRWEWGGRDKGNRYSSGVKCQGLGWDSV